jgi:hypothetical protein
MYARVHEASTIAIAVVIAVAACVVLAGRAPQRQCETGCLKNPRYKIKAIEQALVAYQTDNTDACPKQLDDLYTLGYLTKHARDAWGQPLEFECPGVHNPDGADIISWGKDGLPGTADDLRSWEL